MLTPGLWLQGEAGLRCAEEDKPSRPRQQRIPRGAEEDNGRRSGSFAVLRRTTERGGRVLRCAEEDGASRARQQRILRCVQDGGQRASLSSIATGSVSRRVMVKVRIWPGARGWTAWLLPGLTALVSLEVPVFQRELSREVRPERSRGAVGVGARAEGAAEGEPEEAELGARGQRPVTASPSSTRAVSASTERTRPVTVSPGLCSARKSSRPVGIEGLDAEAELAFFAI